MVLSKHKKGAVETDTLIQVLLLTLTLMVLALVVVFFFSPFKDLSSREYSCYATNQFKGFIEIGKSIWPSPCRTANLGTIDIAGKDEINNQVATYIWKCWWMYGEGKIPSLGKEGWKGLLINEWGSDRGFTCYTFSLKEDLNLHDLGRYMLTHDKDGNALEIKSISDSLYNEIEATDTTPCSFCVDRSKGVMTKGTIIYIMFRDDTQGVNEDQLILTANREFEGNGLSGCGKECFNAEALFTEGR